MWLLEAVSDVLEDFFLLGERTVDLQLDELLVVEVDLALKLLYDLRRLLILLLEGRLQLLKILFDRLDRQLEVVVDIV